MKKTLFAVATAAAAFTCLAWAQPPQGAKETVVIKGDAEAKKPPKETLPDPGAAPKPKVSRDPFVPGGVAAAPPTPTEPVGPKPVPGSRPMPAGKTPPKMAGPAPAPVPPPEVKIHGILMSPRGNRAIVKGPSTTFIVKQGDKLGDYKVSSITNKRVVFAFRDKKFPIKMESEFPDLDK